MVILAANKERFVRRHAPVAGTYTFGSYYWVDGTVFVWAMAPRTVLLPEMPFIHDPFDTDRDCDIDGLDLFRNCHKITVTKRHYVL